MEGLKSVKSQLRGLKTDKVKMIEGNDKVRTQKCNTELKTILAKNGCVLVG